MQQFHPHPYQRAAIEAILDKPGVALWMEMGLGKTVVTLTAIDQLTLPEKIVEDIPVVLDKAAKDAYKKLEKNYLLEVDGEAITAQQAAALTGKLLQLCNGSLYDAEGQVHQIHQCKLDAFDELIDALGGHHLIWYSLPWSLELYAQGEARLYRQGQTSSVIVHRLIVKGGADEMVVKALNSKDNSQNALMQAVRTHIRETQGGSQ